MVNNLVQKKIGKILNPPQALNPQDNNFLPPPALRSPASGKPRNKVIDTPSSSQENSIIPSTPVEPLIQLSTPNRNKHNKKEVASQKRKSTGSRTSSPKKKPPLSKND